MTVTVGSGIGGFAAIASQPTYGAAFVTPTRTLTFKSNKPTWNPHPVQGGPYLAGGRAVDIGSAHKLLYTDATGTLSGDMVSTGMALLLACAFGSSGTLTQSGTTAAYELGGASGIHLELPDTTGSFFDMQNGVPTVNNAELHPINYHSCVITKATWVFDRVALITYEYEWDAQTVEQETALITPSYPAAPEPFAMSTTGSKFKAGVLGSEVEIEGIRKVTFSLDRKMDTSRIYLGEEKKTKPITNNLVDVNCTVEADYTVAGKALYENWLTNTPESFIMEATTSLIGSSGKKNTFFLQMLNGYIETGADVGLDGPDIVKNTLNMKGTINAAAEPSVKAKLITSDTTF